jgi:hypothetical protein
MILKGFNEFGKVLESLEEETPGALEVFMKQQAEETKADIKKGTPVDTGTLKNSWHRSGKGLHGHELSQTIFNATDYAAHVEYGHRIGKGRKRFVKGRFMLRKAVDKRRIKFYRDFEKFVGKLMKK